MKGCIMNEEKKCLRCGGTNLKAGIFQSTGKVYSRPENAKILAFLSSGAPVSSILCFDCGHVELIVDPTKIKLIAKASPNSCRQEEHDRVACQPAANT